MMATKDPKSKSWIKLFLKLACLALFTIAVTTPLFTAVNFCRQADKFVFYVKTGDSVGAQKELEKLHYFYALSGKWKIQWLADKYLFKDGPFYQSDVMYLIENWEEVKRGLKSNLDDPRSFSYGNARFRQAQAEYRATHRIQAPLKLVTTEVKEDFERDLRSCLKSSEYMKCWDRVWNYDLASNKKDAEEALKQPKVLPGFMLGPLKEPEEKGPGEPPGDWPDGKKLEDKNPGSAGPRKRP